MYAVDEFPRCWNCNKLLAERVTRPWDIRCGRCKCSNSHDNQGIPRRTVLVQEEPACPSDLTNNHAR